MKGKDSSGPLNKGSDYKEALNRAADLCSRQEQSTGQIREKLKRWNVNDSDIEGILDQLQKEKFIDDQRFAAFFVKDKFNLNHWGKIKIAHLLRHKGIPENDIQEALEQIDEEAYLQTCLELVSRKSATLKDKNPYTRKGKLYKFAAGRGFEPDLIHRVLNMTTGD